MTPRDVIARRRAERARLIAVAKRFAEALPGPLGVRAVVVFGSVARGDFNVWSDVDVLVVAEHLPTRALDRWAALGEVIPRLQPVAWTPDEWRREHRRSNPIAAEAIEDGVWLLGSPDELEEQAA
jgi:predicted nucleotidyltransferase